MLNQLDYTLVWSSCGYGYGGGSIACLYLCLVFSCIFSVFFSHGCVREFFAVPWNFYISFQLNVLIVSAATMLKLIQFLRAVTCNTIPLYILRPPHTIINIVHKKALSVALLN